MVYRDEDKLYLPVYRMNMIQKYMGIDDALPMLDKMGGKTWEKVREKVRKSVEKIAGELLKLYAERKIAKGHAFCRPDNYFQDFEAGFPYEETEDQLKTIEDVLEDMAKEEPMDRLVCGDVGYGKTEVALRAAFIAVNDSRQVAVLVPTTILAEQHFETFSARFKRYPVRVACLSRFRGAREQKSIIEELKSGAVDIVIGTHRLLSSDVHFRNLGILVVDEEQRFGVRHKEWLKRIRATVDVLTMTATPIPRTLYFSLTGARDMCTILTPPEDRMPVKTLLIKRDYRIIREAIVRELARDGQIFFLHNRIEIGRAHV
jgi:transcription-repair coupling factor (superfamily II helicase)